MAARGVRWGEESASRLADEGNSDGIDRKCSYWFEMRFVPCHPSRASSLGDICSIVNIRWKNRVRTILGSVARMSRARIV